MNELSRRMRKRYVELGGGILWSQPNGKICSRSAERTVPTPERSAAELIVLCLEAGSASAWREFVARFQPLIASVILRSIRRYGESNPSLADDLVQETFLRLCKDDSKALRQFEQRHEDAIFGYLKVVAASVTMDHFRSLGAQKRRGDRLAESEEAIDLHVSTPANAEQSLMLREIDQCIERVSDSKRDQTIFWLYYQQGFTAKDIAQLPNIGLTAKGIESCIYRLTKAVRQAVLVHQSTDKQQKSKGERPPSTLGEVR
jgi:RNA polymerase sigma factor (sigma-70 family)